MTENARKELAAQKKKYDDIVRPLKQVLKSKSKNELILIILSLQSKLNELKLAIDKNNNKKGDNEE